MFPALERGQKTPFIRSAATTLEFPFARSAATTLEFPLGAGQKFQSMKVVNSISIPNHEDIMGEAWGRN